MAEGYAVIENGKIDVRTVSLTNRAAIVNWLVVNHDHKIYSNTTDHQIETLWKIEKGNASVVKVNITIN